MPYYRKSKKTAQTRKTKKRNTVSHKAIVKVAKSVINRQLETKIATYYINGTRLYNISNDTASWRTNNIFYLSPTISGTEGAIIAQGSGQGSRIGNEIKIMKAHTSITLYPYSSNYGTQQGESLDMMMYIVRFRAVYDISDVLNLVENAFFQDGNSDRPLTGTLEDTVHRINEDIIVKSKRILGKLGPAGFGSISANTFMNNDYKYNLHYELDVTPYLKKNYRFNDTYNQPYEGATVLIFSPVSPQNTNVGSGELTCYMAMRHDILYKDG